MAQKVTEQGVEDQRVGHRYSISPAAQAAAETKDEWAFENPNPGEPKRANQEYSAEESCRRIDVSKENEMVCDSHPPPEERQDGGDAATSGRPATIQDYDRRKRQKVENDPHRPHAPVVSREHFEGLFACEWGLHSEYGRRGNFGHASGSGIVFGQRRNANDPISILECCARREGIPVSTPLAGEPIIFLLYTCLRCWL